MRRMFNAMDKQNSTTQYFLINNKIVVFLAKFEDNFVAVICV